MSFEGRPLRADAARNLERVLASARELFAREGIQVQMEEIAAHAGVGIGTLYRRFPTKEALLQAMVQERFRTFTELSRASEDTADPFEALVTAIRRQSEAVEGDAGFQLAVMGGMPLDWDGVEEDLGELAEAYQRLIGRAVDAGQVRPDLEPSDLAMILCGITATMYFEPGSKPDWRRHLDLVIEGMRRR